MAATMGNNLKGQLTLLKSAAEGAGIALYEKFGKQATDAVEKLAGSVGRFSSDLASGDLDGTLAAIGATVAGAATAILALNAALAVKDLMNFATAAKAGAVAMESYKSATAAGAVAQGALNLAQALSPMGWLAIAAGAAATAFAVYKSMTYEATTESDLLRLKLKEINTELDEQTESQKRLADARSESFADIEAETNLVSGYVTELKGLIGENGKVNDGYALRADYLTEQINTLIPNAVSASKDEAGAYYKIVDSIDAMLFAKKKEMILAAWETEYKDALKNRAAAQDLVRESAEAQAAAQDRLDRLREESLSAVGREEEVYATKVFEAQQQLEEHTVATNKAKASVDEYQTTVNGFNTALAAENMDTLNVATAGLSKTLVRATGDNKAELEKAVVDAKTNLDIVVATHAAKWESMTDIQKREAGNQVAELKALVDTQAVEAMRGGVQIPENFATSITESSPLFSDAMNDMVEDGKKTAVTAGVEMKGIAKGYAIFFSNELIASAPIANSAAAVVAGEVVLGADSQKGKIIETGRSFVTGFVSSLTSPEALSTAFNAGSLIFTTSRKGAEKSGEVNSPSRVMKMIGAFFVAGFCIGITDGITQARKAATKLSEAVITEVKSLNDQLAKLQETQRKEQTAKEIAAYEKSIKDKYEELGKAEEKGKQKILDDIAKLQADWNDKQIKAETEAAKLALQERIKSLEDFKKEYDKEIDEIEKKQQSMADKLSAYGDLFQTAKNSRGVEFLELGDLQASTDKISALGEALAKLKERGISDSLMSEITSMSVDDATGYTSLLLEQGDEQYAQYMKKWEENQAAAALVAQAFYADEFAQLKTEFVDKVPVELSGLKTEMEGIGKDSAIGLANGFWEKKDYIVSTFKSVLAAALQEAKDFEEIHSPSRKWAEVGSFMAQGLGVGFAEQMHSVTKQINGSIPTGADAQYTPRMAVADTINGIGAMSAARGQSLPQTIIVQSVLDSRVIAESVIDPMKSTLRQRGVRLT